jgi:hypothetical protein
MAGCRPIDEPSVFGRGEHALIRIAFERKFPAAFSEQLQRLQQWSLVEWRIQNDSSRFYSPTLVQVRE